MLDNTTAIAYINKMGGGGGGPHSLHANAIAREIWCWAMERGCWLSAAHIPGSCNNIADFSRHFHDNTEWTLKLTVFQAITTVFFCPEVDLFASRLNCQVA